jgi:purine catabolism regulator
MSPPFGVAGLEEHYPTVAEVLRLPCVSQGRPTVLAGEQSLERRVEWVHVCEQPDIEEFINGGELVLTSGAGFDRSPAAWTPLVDAISDRGAAALLIELGRYFGAAPEPMVRRARARSLPLITVARSVRFVDVTHSVYKMIRDAHMEDVQRRIHVHETFTMLTVSGADANAVVAQVSDMAGCSVVLENLTHQVLASHAFGETPTELIEGWEYRSRSATSPDERVGYDSKTGWLLARVGAQGEFWGRLVILLDGPEQINAATVIAERAAEALALRRLIDRDRETLEHLSQRSLLKAIVTSPDKDPSEIFVKCRALGVELVGQQLIGGAVEMQRIGSSPSIPQSVEAQGREYVVCLERALQRSSGVSGLVASAGPDRLTLLLSIAPNTNTEGRLRQLADAFHEQWRRLPWACEATVGFGSTVSVIAEAARSCREADHVVTAAIGSSHRQPYYRLQDVHIQGLLHLLREDIRVQAFVERELGRLLTYDDEHGTDLTNVLRVFLQQGLNKSLTARRLFLSRPALYERLTRIEQVVGVSLTAGETALSLHVAIRALDCMREGNRRLSSGVTASLTRDDRMDCAF